MAIQRNARLLEILGQASTLEELDTKIRIRLQEALFNFLRDPRNWSLLTRGEIQRLLKKLIVRSSKKDNFAEDIQLTYLGADGDLTTQKVKLTFDTFRNPNIPVLFNQIINQEVAVVFQENFGFGMVEHLEKLISMEIELSALDEVTQTDETEPEIQTLPEKFMGLENKLPPLSPKDIRFIREQNMGIMIELIPKFLRLPLNKLYNSIVHRAQEFPSLTLQFYLGHYFASRELLALDPLSVESQQHVRTFFSKALYAIHRLGGLTVTELNLPEARRFERYQYLTVNDEDPMPVMKVLTTGVQRLIMIRQKIQKLQHNEQSIRKIKRQEYRVLMEVDLTVERVLEDLFKGYRNQLLQDSDTVTEAQVISQTLWLPDTVPLLDPWEREALEDHLRLITSPDYLDQLPQPERYLIDYWPILAEESSLRGETLAMLEATGIEDPVEFKQEVLLRIAQKHKLIVEQNVQLIFDQIGQRITRMLRLGSLTPEMLVEQRYGDFHLHVLPYIYYFGTKDAHQNDLWVRSPYPCSKMTYLMRLLNKPDFEANPAVKGNRVDLALTQALLQELQRVESLQFDSAIEPEHPTHPGTALGSYPPTESSTLLEDPESEALYLSAPDSLLQL